jgi:hypothetical protein
MAQPVRSNGPWSLTNRFDNQSSVRCNGFGRTSCGLRFLPDSAGLATTVHGTNYNYQQNRRYLAHGDRQHHGALGIRLFYSLEQVIFGYL